MKKNTLRKGVLILLTLTLLSIVFTSCGTVVPPCTTATVNITIPLNPYEYDIYMDYADEGDIPVGTTDMQGNLTLTEVSTGFHDFYALSTDYWLDNLNGTAFDVFIDCGENNVEIIVE
jgi:hypothetical protein